MTNTLRVKICCISSIEEARLAVEYGATALGLVGDMPSGPGIISDALIAEIVRAVPPSIATFLLTSETSAAGVVAHYRKVNTSTIQMVDALSDQGYDEIRDALPMVKLVQVIHVIDQSSVSEALRISKYVDAILLDSGNPDLAVKELGGTGRTHNWKLSAEIRESVNVPIFLAGGMNAGNVARAIAEVQPFGIDLCSGVRSKGKLDQLKLQSFFASINALSIS